MTQDDSGSRGTQVLATGLSPDSVRQRGGLVGDLLVFIIPALQFVEIQIVGRLFASDIILLSLLPFVLRSRGGRLTRPWPRTFVSLGLLWLLAQVVTDLLRDTPFEDYARGWAKIAFFLTSFAALYLLLSRSPRRFVLYALGICAGGMLSFYLRPGVYGEGDPWKFGVGAPLTLFLIVCATNHMIVRRRVLQVLLIALAAFVNLYMGFRALAGVCFLTAAYTGLQRQRRDQELTVRGIAAVALICLTVGFGFLKLYQYGAEGGLLGEGARQKYESQAGGQLGLLIGGRGEILIAAQAIQDSPILGHGSWAKDPELAWLWLDVLRSFGYPVGPGEAVWEGLIPTHSHLFGAWVEAGILGAIFWASALFLALRALLVLPQMRSQLAVLMAFAAFMLMWDVLFSPFGAERRFITAYYLAALISVVEVSRLRGAGV